MRAHAHATPHRHVHGMHAQHVHVHIRAPRYALQELTIKVRNSHLSSALLLELQDECGITANASDFSRLELHTNPFLEKQMQLLIECVDDLQQESNKLQHFDRNLQRQKSAQQQYMLKKKQEAQIRLMRCAPPPPHTCTCTCHMHMSHAHVACTCHMYGGCRWGRGRKSASTLPLTLTQWRGPAARGGAEQQPSLQAHPAVTSLSSNTNTNIPLFRPISNP